MGDVKHNLYDVIVVGAGISGLTAAYRLLQHDPMLNVLVLEAKDRVGGRTLTTTLKARNGEDKWDLGGQWVGRSQVHIMQLINELGLDVHKQFDQGAKFARLSDGNIRKYTSSLPTMSPFALLDLHWLLTKATKLSEEISLCKSDKQCQAKKLDSQTLESFKQSLSWTQGAKELFDSGCGVIFGAHPSQISLLYFLHYCKCAGGIEPLLETGPGSGQEWRIKGGAQGIAQQLMQRIGLENVLLKEVVAEVIQDDSERVNVKTQSGKKLCSKYLVLAIPPHEALKIKFSPPLPFNKEHLLRHMPVGHLIKFVVTYATPFWRENGLSGEVVSFDNFDMTSSATGKNSDPFNGEAPVSIMYDATSANGNPALVGFISGLAATRWTHKTEDEQRIGLVKFLKKFFGKEAEIYQDMAIKDWSKEPWNGGCPVNYASPGALSIYGNCLSDPVGRIMRLTIVNKTIIPTSPLNLPGPLKDIRESIHWAGTETATLWSGFMNGAAQAGTRAANEILTKLDCNYSYTREDSGEPKKEIPRTLWDYFLKFGILASVVLFGAMALMKWF